MHATMAISPLLIKDVSSLEAYYYTQAGLCNFIQQHALFATCTKTMAFLSQNFLLCFLFFFFYPWLIFFTSNLFLCQQTCASYDSTMRLCASYNHSKTRSPHNFEQYTNTYFELYTTQKQGYKLC